MVKVVGQIDYIPDIYYAISIGVCSFHRRDRWIASSIEITNKIDHITHVHYSVILNVPAIAGVFLLKCI